MPILANQVSAPPPIPGWRPLVVVAVVLCIVAVPAVGAATAAGTDNTRKVDVLFVLDASGSNSEEVSAISDEVAALHDRMDTAGVDARFAVVSYRKTPTVQQPLTDNASKVSAAMDFPTRGSWENASDAILGALETDTRTDAETVVVVVTDEDDDSSDTVRNRAISELSGVHFVAISPDEPSTSSCSGPDPHPVCDNSTDNELRTMANLVDGDWTDIDTGQEPFGSTFIDTVMDSVDDIPVGQSTSQTTRTVDRTGELKVTNASVHPETVTVGEAVMVTATFTNVGNKQGSFVRWLATERNLRLIAPRTDVLLDPDENRTVSLEVTFDEPGTHSLVLSGREIGTVKIRQPNPSERRSTETARTIEREVFERRYPHLSWQLWKGLFALEESES